MTSFELGRFSLFCRPDKDTCTADIDPKSPSEMQTITCPIFPGHRRAKRISKLDLIVPCDPVPDVIFTWFSECLIQERLKRIFEDEGITGFSTLPANVRTGRNSERIAVSELVVTGWAGIAQPSSGIREIERCAGCGLLRYSEIEESSKLLDEAKWDGSDFFMIWPLPRYRFVSERVVQVCKKHSVSGVQFLQNLPMARGYVAPGYSPGRLSYFMPEQRAHELGDEAGIF